MLLPFHHMDLTKIDLLPLVSKIVSREAKKRKNY